MSCRDKLYQANQPNQYFQYNKNTVNVKGNPKEILHTSYIQYANIDKMVDYMAKHNIKFDKRGNIVEEEIFNVYPDDDSKRKFKYDKSNNKVYAEIYKINGELERIDYSYLTKEGNLLERRETQKNILITTSSYNYITEADSLLKYEVFGYNPSKHISYIIEERRKNKKTVLLVAYYDIKGEPETNYMKYDEKGNLIYEIDCKNYDSANWSSKSWKSYDPLNRVVYKEYLTSKSHYKSYYAYDTNGNIVKQRNFLHDSLIQKESFNYQYKYDQKGNWIERVRSFENGERHSVMERKILYY